MCHTRRRVQRSNRHVERTAPVVNLRNLALRSPGGEVRAGVPRRAPVVAPAGERGVVRRTAVLADLAHAQNDSPSVQWVLKDDATRE